MIEEAANLGPAELRIIGGRLLERLAPEIADAHEYQRLLAAERRADAATRFSLRRRGDGSTDLPVDRQRGIGFVALLENIPTSSLPRHGGTGTTVMVTLDYDTLLRDANQAGFATTSTGEKVTAGAARRWACQAGIVPVVLGGNSEILDLGRSRRLVSDAIRKALSLRDQGCTTLGCTMPAAFCEAHHAVPWSRGGKTSLDDCELLCPWHHHRAHDPDRQVRHHPHGKTSFHRRT
jgi:hypothetical protein